MKNTIKSFRLYVRPDPNGRSERIANDIRELNSKISNPLVESDDGELVIAIGGDGSFIHAVTDTNFSKDKIYTGIHTGTLGFMQDLSTNDIFSLIQYINHEKELKTRKVYVSSVRINLRDESRKEFFSLNEILVVGSNRSCITFKEYVNDEYLQMISGNGIIIANSSGDTAYSLNAGGALVFINGVQLVCTLETPMVYAIHERFIHNSVVCPKVRIEPKMADNIEIIIDGRKKSIDSHLIESIEVSVEDSSSYINKLDLINYSKVRVVRNKILGYL